MLRLYWAAGDPSALDRGVEQLDREVEADKETELRVRGQLLLQPVQFSAGIDISRMVFCIVMITNSSLV